MIFQDLSDIYSGFYLKEKKGNNAFSFSQRSLKEIFVPPLIQGDLSDLAIGEEVVFSEFFEDKEVNCRGLENFLYVSFKGKHIFIFDNHNHAFVFWFWAYLQGIFKVGQKLIHIDQHKDTRDPLVHLNQKLEELSLEQVFEYSCNVLNVGNFIKPALYLGLFSDVHMLDRKDAFFDSILPSEVLDLDMDVFSNDMNYIDFELKKRVIKEYFNQANLVTIATSPYFIDQTKAIFLIKELFSES